MTAKPRILVVRNDKLGDFMLAWPALRTLREGSKANHIAVLVPDYTAPLARVCPWVDEVIVDPGPKGDRELLAQLREGRFDALLTLFSTSRIGWLGFRAGIALRMAPATKWAQLFYNARIRQRRSRSEKPEYRYNVELAERLLDRLGQRAPETAPPYWPISPEQRQAERQRIAAECGLDPDRPWWFLHPGSGGSAVNLSAERYVELITRVHARLERPAGWLVTFGPNEQANAEWVRAELAASGVDARLMPKREGLAGFACSLAAGDGMIAGSTGPLHIAGCLDLGTVGFYPAKRSATSLRWQTCNDASKRLAFSPPADGDPAAATDMSRIDLDAAAAPIAALIERLRFT
ncbi:glycosyltransferase family 9 protein [Halotalea alkalilenta]|uniref:glycosyltransferase family 9 protein n=1 Tax=Halotalea alkalilenta TaxID=376489 RepID=UPI0004888A03|nr:glycosyltransferase family 9 protein [Halotalea alkalilenta]